MNLTQIIAFIGALGLGVGSILGIVIKNLLDKNTEVKMKLKTINEEKYRTILIYMSIVLNPANKDHFVLNDNILYDFSGSSDIQNMLYPN